MQKLEAAADDREMLLQTEYIWVHQIMNFVLNIYI